MSSGTQFKRLLFGVRWLGTAFRLVPFNEEKRWQAAALQREAWFPEIAYPIRPRTSKVVGNVSVAPTGHLWGLVSLIRSMHLLARLVRMGVKVPNYCKVVADL
jgi:hypothetical protein